MMIELLQRIERLERQMHNIVLLGTIAEADYAAARVKVTIGDLITGWLPWLTQRAGGDVTWHAPEVGEQVMVISSSGEIGNGVVLPAIYQDAYPANGTTPDQRVTTYSDGAVIDYDRVAHHLTVSLPDGGTIAIVGDISVTGSITTTGDVVAAGVSLEYHTHTGDSGGITSVPN